MTNYKLIFSLVSGLLLIILGILVWRTSVLFTDFASMFPDTETGSELALNKETSGHEATISLSKPPQIVDNSTDSSNFGHYETIEETIARIKRDVYVTGAIISASGQEVALFQIEGMPDRSFNIKTQLMDGFIITEITSNHVVLKNQIGDETFSLKLRNRGRDAAAESLSEEVVGNEVVLLPGGDADPGMRSVIDEQVVNPSQYGVNVINEQNYPSDMTGAIGAEPTPRVDPSQFGVNAIQGGRFIQ